MIILIQVDINDTHHLHLSLDQPDAENLHRLVDEFVESARKNTHVVIEKEGRLGLAKS